MENGDNFWVRYNGGTGWNFVANYVAGTDFKNGSFYHGQSYINEDDYTFPDNMDIRFQCDASDDDDDVYIDDITVSAQ